MNCGARSCPPIAFYHPERLHQQLEIATQAFLESGTEIYLDKREVRVTRLFLWYYADFRASKGIRQPWSDKLNLPAGRFNLVFKPYDRREALRNCQ